jgi:phosphatidylserine/phosphatidylglycerophosphate/cardiolipin synthase-like enzyme
VIEVNQLHPGAQTADEVATRVAAFLSEARESLDLALYDLRLPGQPGDVVAGALREASERGVRVRVVYNTDHDERLFPPPPRTKPELLDKLPFDTRGVPGVPDLMHHKYVVRDRESVWTGSTNWTTDSWTIQENVVMVVHAPELAAEFTQNFQELWQTGDVSDSGHREPRRLELGGGDLRAWFTPGHGEELSHQIARAIGKARRRIRIASPVITAGPVLGTLAQVAAEARVDVRGVVDRTQMDGVVYQWRTNGRSAWKIPILASVFEHADFKGKVSVRWTPESIHDFMHAKVAVCDDTLFAGSFNLSRSGEQNAENVVELEDPELAELVAGFVDVVRERYEAMPAPDGGMRGSGSPAPPPDRP